MDFNAFIAKYGLEGTSMIIHALAEAADKAEPGRWNLDTCKEMANDLHAALESHYQQQKG
jgi:hypothetical protein